MNHRTADDVMAIVAAANPVTTRSTRTETLDDPYAEGLLARITATPPTRRAVARRPRRLWTRATALLSALAAALAAVFAAAPATASDVLRDAATAAAEQVLDTGQYWYVNTEVEYPGQPAFPLESWHSADIYLQRNGRAAATDAAQNGRDELDPDLIRVREVRDQDGHTVGFGGELRLTRSQVAMLSTDRDTLRRQVLQHTDHTPHGDDFAAWQATVGLLWSAPLTPEQRHAAWELLADSPSIRHLGTMTDSAGRSGEGIEADWSLRRLGRQTIIVDVEHGTLLEVRDHENDGVTQVHRTTILDAGTRDHAPDIQPSACGSDNAITTSC
ncbi:hypothetical protein Xcel_0030 [Xylanimonas cellulosilytica DSM 15894]|uniref:CU044_5270 family protein n=1 Tax=Xylanimonas cellulosilytica (strain DSM 15894 / JCM 12276 / CECT 5975 / KCTC 9989 / LMG 20990 / NBRC 107835 / XIL07) TaxID=446471 RepID=D1BTC9_XYLCX|nr:hypothetical protein [Xylanimonas cellulosilytica]ACZ29071.1 hypothetical protein Xcel_0030 [Xylanimonas cellulosilytica DSM 15894]